MFRELAMRKMEEQEKKVRAMEEMLAQLPKVLARTVREQMGPQPSETEIKQLSWQLRQVEGMMERVVSYNPEHKIKITATVWIWIAMVLVTAVAVALAVNAIGNKRELVRNDTKYRMLQLDTANKPLQAYLIYVDSVYRNRDEIRDWVLKEQETMTENLERLNRAERLEKDAKNLRKKAGR